MVTIHEDKNECLRNGARLFIIVIIMAIPLTFLVPIFFVVVVVFTSVLFFIHVYKIRLYCNRQGTLTALILISLLRNSFFCLFQSWLFLYGLSAFLSTLYFSTQFEKLFPSAHTHMQTLSLHDR